MGGRSACCIVNCKNTRTNSQCKFYTFPAARCKIDQRKKWLAAVKRINPDGSTWIPKPHHLICSAHFIGNQKSNNPLNPSYVPTIFPPVYKDKREDEASKINRHARFMERRKTIEFPESTTVKKEQPPMETSMINVEKIKIDPEANESESLKYADKECQAEIFFNCFQPHKTFICNRYIGNIYNDVEIQTEITDNKGPVIISNQKKFEDKQCETVQKTYVDKATGPIRENEISYFMEFSSVKKNQKLLNLTGVTFDIFNILLKILSKSPASNSKISKEDRLFIVLIKIKSGMPFSAISILFGVDRVTVSRIFFSTLQELTSATPNFVFWPDRNSVRATMPQFFHPDYSDTRVIIYCTEFKVEVPPNTDNRETIYSHNKKGFTAKVLIGVTPGGLISFKSKVAGGRMSDSQIITESGLLDLLEDGDKVLADKNYSQIQQSIVSTGKNVLIVVPPLQHNKKQSDKEENMTTCSAAKVHMHMKRIMKRLKAQKILNKVPTNLFHSIDDILHMCCVLVNIQPLDIADTIDENND